MHLITGGNGRLGKELQKLYPDALCPSHEEMDISIKRSVSTYFSTHDVSQIIHCAAYTSPPKCDDSPLTTLNTNIMGTCILVEQALLRCIPLVYISTEYVFDGQVGWYTEEDPVLPVNRYAWSKLGGECAVQILPDTNKLIIRCAFTPKEFPYDKAPVDQYTSRDTVDFIAGQIYNLIQLGATGIYHIGSYRKSVYDHAVKISPEKKIEPCRVRDLGFRVPRDASLDTMKYQQFVTKED